MCLSLKEGEVRRERGQGTERSKARGLIWVCRKDLRDQIGRRRENAFKVELFWETERTCRIDMKLYMLQ